MADQKITELTENTSPAATDLLPLVDDVSGTPSTQKVEIETLAASEYFNVNSLSRQAIINGNFDVWQRGTTWTSPATNTFTSDRWQVAYTYATGPILVHSRQPLTPGDIPNAFYHYRIAPDGAGTDNAANIYYLRQKIEHGTRLLAGNGKKVTVSFYARSSIANKKLAVFLAQNYGTTGSPTSQENINGTNWTLTSSWTKYTYTFTTNTLVGKTFGTDNNDWLGLYFMLSWGSKFQALAGDTVVETFVGSGTIDIAQVQLCAGEVALPFQPKSFEEELKACQRYYEKSYDYATAPGTASTPLGAFSATDPVDGGRFSIPYKVSKRTTASVVIYSNITGAAGKYRDTTSEADFDATVQTAYSSENNFAVDLAAHGAAGEKIAFHYVADAEL